MSDAELDERLTRIEQMLSVLVERQQVREWYAVEEFARNDPYVANGLVTRWEVRHWAVVIGGDTSEASPKAV